MKTLSASDVPAVSIPDIPRPAHPQETTDSILLALIQSGDEAAMACLYDSYSRIVYSVALRVLRDPSAAEDVLQDVFLRIWRSPSSFVSARGSIAGWLAIISRNRSIDLLRKRRPMDSVDDLPLQSSINVFRDVEGTVMAERVKSLIAGLPAAQREALDLAFFQGFTHFEIAEKTLIPLGTIKTRIRTALLGLRCGLSS